MALGKAISRAGRAVSVSNVVSRFIRTGPFYFNRRFVTPVTEGDIPNAVRVIKRIERSLTTNVGGDSGEEGTGGRAEDHGKKKFAWREFLFGGGAVTVSVGLFKYVFPDFDHFRDSVREGRELYSLDATELGDITYNIPTLPEELINEESAKEIVRDLHSRIFLHREISKTRKVVVKGEDYGRRDHILNYGLHKYLQAMNDGRNRITVAVIDAGNWESLERDYNNLGRELRVPVDTLSLENKRRQIEGKLKLRGDWVIVFDNVRKEYKGALDGKGERSISIDEYIPEVNLGVIDSMVGYISSGQVIIVPAEEGIEFSRNMYNILDLDADLYSMTYSAAERLMRNYLGDRVDSDKLGQIVREVEYIPDCIRGAAGLIRQGVIDVDGYLKLLRQGKKEYFQEYVGQLHRGESRRNDIATASARAVKSHYDIAYSHMNKDAKRLFEMLLPIGDGEISVEGLVLIVGDNRKINIEPSLRDLVEFGFMERGNRRRDEGYRIVSLSRKAFIEDRAAELSREPEKTITVEEYTRSMRLETVRNLNKVFTAENPSDKQKEKNRLLLSYVDRVIGDAISNDWSYYGGEATRDEVEAIVRLMDSASNYHTSVLHDHLTGYRYLGVARGLMEERVGIEPGSAKDTQAIYESLARDGGGIGFAQAYARLLYSYGRLYFYTKDELLGGGERGDITIDEARRCFELSRGIYERIFDSEKYQSLTIEQRKDYQMEHMLTLRSGTYQLHEVPASKEELEVQIEELERLRKGEDFRYALLALEKDPFHQSQCNYLLAGHHYQLCRENLVHGEERQNHLNVALTSVLNATSRVKPNPKHMILLADIILEARDLNITGVREQLKNNKVVSELVGDPAEIGNAEPRDIALLISDRLARDRLPHARSVANARYKEELAEVRRIEGEALLERCNVEKYSGQAQVCEDSRAKFEEAISLQHHNLLRGDRHHEVAVLRAARDKAIINEMCADDVRVFRVTDVIYDNKLLNTEAGVSLLRFANKHYGVNAFDLLSELGRDEDYAQQILNVVAEQGEAAVLNRLMGLEEAISSKGSFAHTELLTNVPSDEEGGATPEEGDNDSAVNKVVTYYIPSSSNLDDNSFITPLLIIGASIVRLVETKEAFRYILSEVVPININFIIGGGDAEDDSIEEQQQEQAEYSDNPYQLELYNDKAGISIGNFISEHGPWVGLHLIGGMAVTFSFSSEQISLGEKILSPVISSSSYASRHLYHSHVKQQLLGEEYANSCAMNVLADSAFGAMTSLPYSIMTGSPAPMIYGTAQAAAISVIGCLSSSNTNNEESSYISSTAANIVTAGGVVYSYHQGALTLTFNTAKDVVYSISKIASTVSVASLVHRTTKIATDSAYYLWYGDGESENNNIEPPKGDLSGQVGLDTEAAL